MIKLKTLLREGPNERKYLLPPYGEMFQVRDHVGWASRNILSKKYGNYNVYQLRDLIDKVYDDLELLGYKIFTFSEDDTLYIRGNNAIRNLTSSQRREIENLVIKIADEGTHYQIQMEDDGGNYEILWSHS